ncbi:flippase-like domain-containing protein [SAR202 cluster bacterium AC-409-J13_OGT_754m]|nr:flippase-like domain-containing protein [SAR202 cluster bacterium AC-409-J13_OGT_754m]
MLGKAQKFIMNWFFKGPAQMLIGALCSATFGWIVINDINWSSVWNQTLDLPIPLVFLALLLVLGASAIRAFRWQMLFIQDRVSVGRLFLVQNIGFGVGSLAPVRLLGEVTQFALLRWRYRVTGGTAIVTMGLERLFDLVVTVTLLLVGLALVPNMGDFVPYGLGMLLVAIVSLFMVRIFSWASSKSFFNKFPVIASAAVSLSDLAGAKGNLASTFFLTFVYWILIGIAAWVIAFGMNLGISPFMATIAIIGTIYMATSIPSLPAALGTFEFAIVYALKLFGIQGDIAFSYALIMHVLLFLPPILITLGSLSLIGLSDIKGLKQPELDDLYTRGYD